MCAGHNPREEKRKCGGDLRAEGAARLCKGEHQQQLTWLTGSVGLKNLLNFLQGNDKEYSMSVGGLHKWKGFWRTHLYPAEEVRGTCDFTFSGQRHLILHLLNRKVSEPSAL